MDSDLTLDLCSRACVQQHLRGVSCTQGLPWDLTHPGSQMTEIWLQSEHTLCLKTLCHKELYETQIRFCLTPAGCGICSDGLCMSMRRISGTGMSDEHGAAQVKLCVK